MELRERFVELREEELRFVPRYRVGAPAPRRLALRRLAAASALLMIVCAIFFLKPRPTFTDEDRAAAHAIAAWHPPTDFLLRMPSTGVSR